MKLPFYLRKNRTYFKDKKLYMEFTLNRFDKFLCLIDAIWTRLQYFRKDSIWPSRKWNWNCTDYIDLKGRINEIIN